MLKKHNFHIAGTHCASCKILVEDILSEQDFVINSRVNLEKEILEIETDIEKEAEDLAQILTDKIKMHGYTLATQKIIKESKSDEVIWKALPIGLAFLAVFFLLQKSGILSFGIGGKITPTTGFIIGLIASLSSCLAVVGGLILSLSAKIVEEDQNNKFQPAKKLFFLFHAGRLVGFALLGGILGLVGKVIGINFTFSAMLGLIASAVMVLLGFNLVGALKTNKLALPNRLFSFFRKVEHKTFAPILVGVGTFFLPCGFTQSMQVSAIGSGSFFSGLLIMLAFSLGTLPMLALLSFGSESFAHSKYAPLFFKSSGVVVIGLGVFAFLAGLAGLGIINPLFSI